MKCASLITAVVLALCGSQATAQGNDLEARIDELEAALDHLQGRIERLEEQQAPRRVSEAEAEAVLKKKQAEEECTAELGPAPEFAPVLGTKVNPEFMTYLKKHRACMRDKGVP
jgi:TolA-binding protein